MTSMEEAIAAGDGTLHGAIDYWQEKHAKLLAALRAYTDSLSSGGYVIDEGHVKKALRKILEEST